MGWLETLMGIQTKPDLATCEQRIQRGLAAYRDAGEALKTIRDERLYRQVAETFEGYLRLRWQMSPQHAERLIAAADVATTVSPTGGIPQTERAARPLTSLPKEDQLEAWAEASEAAAPAVPTSKHVEAAVARRKNPSAKERAKTVRLKVPGAIVTVEPGKGFAGIEKALVEALAKVRARMPGVAINEAA
jgi:hypothetical protein